MPLEERISEMPILNWQGCRVRVSIEVPNIKNTMTSQTIIDERDFKQLKYLFPPFELQIDQNNSLRMMEYQTERAKAQSLVDVISGRIAAQICRAIGEHIKQAKN